LYGFARQPDALDTRARRGLDFQATLAHRDFDLPGRAEEAIAEHARGKRVLGIVRRIDDDALGAHEQPQCGTRRRTVGIGHQRADRRRDTLRPGRRRVDQVRAADELGDERVGGIVLECRGRCGLHQRTVAQHDDAIGE
jgi:hypothetical protein